MQTPTSNHPDVSITLRDRESLAVFRALLEYKNLLRWSLLQGQDEIIEAELRAIEAASEKISLATYYPEDSFGGDGD